MPFLGSTTAGNPIDTLRGKPSEIREYTQGMRDTMNDMERTITQLIKLWSGSTQVGKLADSMKSRVRDIGIDLANVAVLYDAVRPHVKTYASELADLKPLFRTAVTDIEDAKEAVKKAEAGVECPQVSTDSGSTTVAVDYEKALKDAKVEAEKVLAAAEEELESAYRRYDTLFERWQTAWRDAARGIKSDSKFLVRQMDPVVLCDPYGVPLEHPDPPENDGLWDEIMKGAKDKSSALADWTGLIPGVSTVTGGADAIVTLLAWPTNAAGKKDVAEALFGVIPGSKYAEKLSYLGKRSDEANALVRAGRKVDKFVAPTLPYVEAVQKVDAWKKFLDREEGARKTFETWIIEKQEEDAARRSPQED